MRLTLTWGILGMPISIPRMKIRENPEKRPGTKAVITGMMVLILGFAGIHPVSQTGIMLCRLTMPNGFSLRSQPEAMVPMSYQPAWQITTARRVYDYPGI